ncbi:MAG: FAD-dependent oxidoreductase [Actinomycetota bacterium]
MTVDVLVVGAGVAGLAAARACVADGRSVRVIDKSRGVGGRMASRRVGDARFDHGAQFFTVRSPEFAEVVDAAADAGAVVSWTNGFDDEPDGYPRWRGATGMTDLCKWMAADAGIAPLLSETVTDLRSHPARAYVLTAPVPQSLAVLSFSAMLPDPMLQRELAAIAYKPTIAILASLDRAPTGFPAHGGRQFPADHPELAFVTDNQAKGVSTAPAVTIHLSNDRSLRQWNEPDDAVVGEALDLVADLLGEATATATQVQRWRYAGPVETHPEATLVWGRDPVVALAGEAFAGPKVEGAFRSGLAAGAAVLDRLG